LRADVVVGSRVSAVMLYTSCITIVNCFPSCRL
jgi:hypothetical protein